MKIFQKRKHFPFFQVLLFAFCCLYLINAPTIRVSVRSSLQLCGNALIPSLFPILVFSRLLTSPVGGGQGRNESAFRLFSKPLILGWIFGYPVGAVLMSEAIPSQNKNRQAPLLYLSCGTSATFILSFVGYSLLENPILGVLLYLSQTLALFLLSLPHLVFFGKAEIGAAACIKDQISLSEGIRRAALDMLFICGCVLFFGSFADLLTLYLPRNVLLFLIPWIEVCGAVSRLSAENGAISRLLLGFSVGFGGFSATLQMLPYVKKGGGTARGLLGMRFLVGVLTALFFFTFSSLQGS